MDLNQIAQHCIWNPIQRLLLNTIQCHTVSSASTALNAEKLFCATEYLCTKERILHPAVVVTTACIRCQTFWLSVAKLIRGGGGTWTRGPFDAWWRIDVRLDPSKIEAVIVSRRRGSTAGSARNHSTQRRPGRPNIPHFNSNSNVWSELRQVRIWCGLISAPSSLSYHWPAPASHTPMQLLCNWN